MRALLIAIVALAALARPAWAATDEVGRRAFPFLTVGLTGGFQLWSLSGMEEAVDARSSDFASDGYALEDASFGTSYAYGLEFQCRLSQHWFARAQMDWTRFSTDDRDRRALHYLGGRERTPVSIATETRVQTHPVLFSLGFGRAWRTDALRWAVSTGLVVAPMRVIDEISVYMESETVSEIESTGTGVGGDLSITCDYFTESNMNLFAEIFGRSGATEVELTDGVWESTILPGQRRVDLDGVGFRLGFRWI